MYCGRLAAEIEERGLQNAQGSAWAFLEVASAVRALWRGNQAAGACAGSRQ